MYWKCGRDNTREQTTGEGRGGEGQNQAALQVSLAASPVDQGRVGSVFEAKLIWDIWPLLKKEARDGVHAADGKSCEIGRVRFIMSRHLSTTV